jgi:protein tyrosine phosphatase domain-containing protein 1
LNYFDYFFCLVKHFNFSWRDMTAPTISMMHDIVNIACDEIAAGGKIAVHCHAGFGRTGLTIACIMIANDHTESSQVIQFVRKRR